MPIYGRPGDEPGDQKVYKVLSTLPSDWVVYAQPHLVHKREQRDPDYVLVHQERGVIVLEVKDWITIRKRYPKKALVYRHTVRREEEDVSPVWQAKTAAQLLSSILEENDDLRNYCGKLDFPYRFAGVLPHLASSTITWLEQAWGKDSLLGRTDLTGDSILDALLRIPAPFTVHMTQEQFDVVRAMLDGRLIARDFSSGTFKGIYNPNQESIAKAPMIEDLGESAAIGTQADFLATVTPKVDARVSHLEGELPDEVKKLKSASHVRLVRGYAGTGKTDVLILRAHYLHSQYPDKHILVATFNKPICETRLRPELKALKDRVKVATFDSLCSDIYRKKMGLWVEPQNTLGMVTHMAEDMPEIENWGVEFVADEIVWMKEIGRTFRQAYLENVREGRGGPAGRTLGVRQKEAFFDLFKAYQGYLRELPAHDWADMHDKVLSYLQSGTEPDRRYEVILIDEAQHFAPAWMKIIAHFLLPGGEIFLCDDPNQSVYRTFSWSQKNVDVVGRTKWLRIPYRTTRQIFEIAYELIQGNSLAQQLLKESGDYEEPILNQMRDGEQPGVHQFSSAAKEKDFFLQKIKKLIEIGMMPEEIAILHTEKHVLARYRAQVKGVQVDDLSRQTGTEYKAVFIPRADDLFKSKNNITWEYKKAKDQILFYTAMTRARDTLFVGVGDKWPKSLDSIKDKFKWYDHSME